MKTSPNDIEAAPYWLVQDVGGVGAGKKKNKHSTQQNIYVFKKKGGGGNEQSQQLHE